MASNKGSIVKRVVAKIRQDEYILLFHDQYKNPFVSVKGDGTQVYEIGSEECDDWLLNYVMENFDNTVLINNQPKNVSETLRGFACVYGPKIRLELRNYHEKTDDGDIFWVDLGESAVKVTPKGWSIVACPPILFKRHPCQIPQAIPEKGGSIWSLFDFIHVTDPQDQLLIIAYIVAAIVPTAANKPILALTGDAGSGKTECTKIIKSVTDPTVPAILPAVRKITDLDFIALTNAVMAFDNISSMKAAVEDHFCCLATGAGVRIKVLYHTNKFITFEAIRPIIVNGVSQAINQSDLLNRCVPVKLSPIDNYAGEVKFREDFEQAKPFILGAVFDLLSKAMAIYSTIPDNIKWPRMTEFARWGFSSSAALGDKHTGEDFLAACETIKDRQNEFAMESNPLAQAIIWLMEDKDVWEGSASELLKETTYRCDKEGYEHAREMQFYNKSPYWPKNPRATSVALDKIKPNLKSVGIEAMHGKQKIYLINTAMPITEAAKKWLDELDPHISMETPREQGKTLADYNGDNSRYIAKPVPQNPQISQDAAKKLEIDRAEAKAFSEAVLKDCPL
jgi:hypothetical protein